MAIIEAVIFRLLKIFSQVLRKRILRNPNIANKQCGEECETGIFIHDTKLGIF
jgi:hypothetical protein